MFIEQLEQFEKLFGNKPLWFRTIDEVFPPALHSMLWEAEVNALGSSVVWNGGDPPPVTEGEILSVPHHREKSVELTELKNLTDRRDIYHCGGYVISNKSKCRKKYPNN